MTKRHPCRDEGAGRPICSAIEGRTRLGNKAEGPLRALEFPGAALDGQRTGKGLKEVEVSRIGVLSSIGQGQNILRRREYARLCDRRGCAQGQGPRVGPEL